MSVIKRSKQNIANFRPPTTMQENESGETNENPTENEAELRRKMIEDMAISMQENRHTRKNPLDKHSTNVNI